MSEHKNSLDYSKIRAEYPDLAGHAYFNTSSIALPPKRGLEAVENYWRGLAEKFCENANPVHDKICEDARNEIAKLIGCSPKEIAFTKNTCDGITQFVHAYPFQTGDNIVVTDQEYPSNLYPWLMLEQNGVEVRVVKFPEDETAPDVIVAACDEHTKAVTLSATFFCTGFRMDLKKLGDLCRERGILLVVDSIQSLGRLVVRPKELGISFMANGGHKCLLGMKGSGFLYCDEKLLPVLTPYTACRQSLKSWHRPPLERHFSELNWREDAGCFESGNPNYIGILAMERGVSLINEIGLEEIEKHVLELEKTLRKRLEKEKIPVKTRKEKFCSGILFITIPEDVAEKRVQEIFLAHQVYATIREGYIRISIHLFNTESDLDQLLDALKEVKKESQLWR